MTKREFLLKIINLPEEEAFEFAKLEGYKARVTENNGMYYIVTMDLNTGRVNLRLEDGIVIGANFG